MDTVGDFILDFEMNGDNNNTKYVPQSLASLNCSVSEGVSSNTVTVSIIIIITIIQSVVHQANSFCQSKFSREGGLVLPLSTSSTFSFP